MESYQWADGARIKSDATAVGKRFAELRKRNGGKLDPEAVVEDARDTRAPHHGEFEWNDTLAAQRDRISTARYLMRSIVEIIVTTKGTKRSFRAYFPVVKHQERAYRATKDIMVDQDLREQVVTNALKEHEAWEERYERIASFATEVEMLIEAGRKARESYHKSNRRGKKKGARPPKDDGRTGIGPWRPSSTSGFIVETPE